jgi:hypothetical protein
MSLLTVRIGDTFFFVFFSFFFSDSISSLWAGVQGPNFDRIHISMDTAKVLLLLRNRLNPKPRTIFAEGINLSDP